jgi:hypothetical protein
MNDEDRQMDSTNTPGSGASPPEPPRPPEVPDELWGMWRPGVEVWLPQDPSRNYRDNPLGYTKREAAQERADDWNRRMKHDIRASAIPALLGVSPAARERRDKLGEALAEAESEIQCELDWLLTIKATDGLKYRHLKECQRRWGILLIEWREAQGREHEGSTADG